MTDFVLTAAGGEMGKRIRARDWAATPLGSPGSWPSSLRVTLDLCLNSAFPMAIYWGPDLRLIYNDSWSPIPGKRHPDALGRPAHEVWPDIWSIVGPQFAEVMTSGHGYLAVDQILPMTRSGRLEESYWDYSFTPIMGRNGAVMGILNQGHEVTARVMEQRQHALLLDLAERTRGLDTPDAIVRAALDVVGPHMLAMRAGYVEVDIAGGSFRIVANWRREETVRDLSGVHPLAAFDDDVHAALRSGRVVAISDAVEDLRQGDPAIAARYAGSGVRAGLIVPLMKNGVYAAAVFVHSDTPRYWTDHHIRLLSTVAERIWQERARAEAGRALRESERRHRLIFEQANDIIFTTDLHQTITGANPAAGAALGRAPGDIVGRSIAEFVSTDQFDLTSGMLRPRLAGRGTTRYDVAVQAGDGRVLHWEVSSTLATDDDGQPIGLHAIARDVSERYRHETEQRRLIDELNHRVKNMLAQVQGLAQQSFRAARPVAEAQAAFQARLSALAAAYDLLTAEKWGGATLEETVAGGTRLLDYVDGRVSRGGAHVTLNPKTAVSLVMAFHELAINAREHGALLAGTGRVDVTWRIRDGRLLIEWRESGGPAVTAPARRGFGLRMVERALTTDLSAHVTLDFAPDGLIVLIDAPLGQATHCAFETEEPA